MLLFMWTTSIRAWVEQVWQQSRGMLQQVLAPPASGGAVRSSPPPRRGYATDMTDAEWQLVRPLVNRPQTGSGPRRRVDLRAMRNAIWYTLRTGSMARAAQGRSAPSDGAEFCSSLAQTWHLHDDAGDATQRVNTTRVGGPERGTDGGNHRAGRTRYGLVDTVGVLGGSWCMRPMAMMATEPNDCWPTGVAGASRCATSGLTRPIGATWRPGCTRTAIRQRWRSSNVLRDSRDSRCCPAAGSWNARWPG